MRIGMTYDLRDDYLRAGYSTLETAEFDRAATVDCIERNLLELGHTTDRIGNVKALATRLVAGDRWDLVFNICEGMYGLGREAQVPALLDAWNIPYTFSDTLVCAFTLHKGVTKKVVMAEGIPSPAFAEIRRLQDLEQVDLGMPVFAKPIGEGTGKGITAASRITSAEKLRSVCAELLETYKQPVLVETFLPGREFTTGVLGTGDKARVLGTMEVCLNDKADQAVYSYHNKEYFEELVSYRLLEEPELTARIEEVVLDAWRVLGCRDAGRIDIRLAADGTPNFLEVNPLAGLDYAHSDLPILAGLKGMPFLELITHIIESAQERCAPGVESGRRVA
jgi:D-alanine-D-alanine ligase